MKNYIKLMRPKHYLKNFLVFIPLLFSGNFFEEKMILKVIFAFVSFSLAASVVYIINDIRDKEKDKLHEKKKNRPIASGKVPVPNAIAFSILLIIMSVIFNYLAIGKLINISYIFILIYVIINIFYSFGLKDVPIIDIAILVSGFVIRVLYGASVINIVVSNWLYLTVMSLSFYLGLGKRRNEYIKQGAKSRNVLMYYTKDFLDKNMYIFLAISIVFYTMWTVDPIIVNKTNNLMIWTVPIMMLLCMKYSMNVESDNYGDPVDVITSDKTLLVLGIIYCIIVAILIYIPF